MNIKIQALVLGGAMVVLSAAGVQAVAQERSHGRFAQHAQLQHHMIGGEAPWISIALRHKTELNLSADQIGNLEKIRAAFQNQVAPVAQQLKALEGELSAILQETPANLVLARTKIDQAEKLRAELRYLRVESLENGKSVLTAQQRDQLKTLVGARQHGMTKPSKRQSS
jgi:Spy/CpxP family protein refolding chaperone